MTKKDDKVEETTAPEEPSPDVLLAAQLQSWADSTDPVGWAPTAWQPIVVAARAGDKAAVDAAIKVAFPDAKIKAADVLPSKDHNDAG